MANLISSRITASSPDSTTITYDYPISSGPGLSKGQMETILSRMQELSDLIRESTASLHQNVNGSRSFPGPEVSHSPIERTLTLVSSQ